MSTFTLLEICEHHVKDCGFCQQIEPCRIGEAWMKPLRVKLISSFGPRRMQAKQFGVGEQGVDERVSAPRQS